MCSNFIIQYLDFHCITLVTFKCMLKKPDSSKTFVIVMLRAVSGGMFFWYLTREVRNTHRNN
jgi:hypothetical protein